MTDPFENLSPEDLKSLRDVLDAKLEQNKPAEFSVRLPSGAVATGSPEQIQEQINAYWAEQQQQQQPPQRQTEDRPQFDQKQFYTKAEKSFDEGMQYYYETKFGYDPNTMITLLANGMNKLVERISEFDYDRFLGQNKNFTSSDKNRKVLDGLIKEMHWDNSAKSYENAYILAEGKGLLEKEKRPQFEIPRTTPQPGGDNGFDGRFAPPRLGGGGYEDDVSFPNATADEFFNKTISKSPDEIRSMLEQLEGRFTN